MCTPYCMYRLDTTCMHAGSILHVSLYCMYMHADSILHVQTRYHMHACRLHTACTCMQTPYCMYRLDTTCMHAGSILHVQTQYTACTCMQAPYCMCRLTIYCMYMHASPSVIMIIIGTFD